jgi:segregation and condensation protein A
MSDFVEDSAPPTSAAEGLLLHLDGFDGPLDLLLELARTQKVDLSQISILALAEQYLQFVTQARRLRLELAADYLVMAAWLAYLKSRLLVPTTDALEDDEPTGEALAALLAFQLQRLEAMRASGQRLMDLPQLGRDLLARGAPEVIGGPSRVVYDTSLFELLKAYGDFHRRHTAGSSYRPAELDLHSAEDALVRLRHTLAALSAGWVPMSTLLPPLEGDGLKRRSAVASTFLATLELVRDGVAEIRQSGVFGPVQVRRAPAADSRDRAPHD